MTASESMDADSRGSNANVRGYPSALGSRVVASTRTTVIRENPRTIREHPRLGFLGDSECTDRREHFPPNTCHCCTDGSRCSADRIGKAPTESERLREPSGGAVGSGKWLSGCTGLRSAVPTLPRQGDNQRSVSRRWVFRIAASKMRARRPSTLREFA